MTLSFPKCLLSLANASNKAISENDQAPAVPTVSSLSQMLCLVTAAMLNNWSSRLGPPCPLLHGAFPLGVVFAIIFVQWSHSWVLKMEMSETQLLFSRNIPWPHPQMCRTSLWQLSSSPCQRLGDMGTPPLALQTPAYSIRALCFTYG